MSANAYIDWTDVPQQLAASSNQRVDETTQAELVAFDGCPLVGSFHRAAGGYLGVEFPFPRSAELREQLIEWLLHWGISFTVLA